MKKKDRVFLMDAPLAPSGLLDNAVDSVIDRYRKACKQAAAFQRFLPRRSIVLGAMSPLISPHHWGSRLTLRAFWRPPRPFCQVYLCRTSVTLLGGLRLDLRATPGSSVLLP